VITHSVAVAVRQMRPRRKISTLINGFIIGSTTISFSLTP
jgi:hypothetical protein